MNKTSAISTENFFIKAFNKIILSDDRKNLLLTISAGILQEYKNEGTVNTIFN